MVMRILPCLFCLTQACRLITFEERVAPQPQVLSGVASTSSMFPVLGRMALREGFCPNFFFRQMYMQSSEVPRSCPSCLI